MSDGDSDPAGLLLPAVVERSLIEEGIGMFFHPNKKPAHGGLGGLVDFSLVDFMIWKGIILVVLAIIYGFWQGITGR